jgi:hypothetical protein
VLVVVSLVPIQTVQPSAFADPAFARYFNQPDPLAQSLLWGSGPLLSVVEPYTGAPGNRRLVQYFDRGRMEMASSDDSSGGALTYEVTQGLLVREMASGNVQVGNDAFVQGDPASLPIFGTGGANPGETALTYADFASFVAERAGDRTNSERSLIEQWIEPGRRAWVATPPMEVRAARYVDVTGHNIPDVIVAWFDREPFGDVSVQDALGYPITEAFWVVSGKGSAGISLIQLYERRVIVYTPDLPEGERFTLTNAGRHYYRWRYGSDLASGSATQRSVVPVVRDDAGLTLPQGYQASVLRRNLPDLFGVAVSPGGHLILGHTDGSVTMLDPSNPDARPSAPLVEHLVHPVALAYAGTDLYVVDDSGLRRYRDLDADGKIDVTEDIIAPRFLRETVALAPGPDGALYYCGQLAGANGTSTAAAGSRSVVRIDPGETLAMAVTLEIEGGGSVLVDTDDVIWLIDMHGRLVQIEMGVDRHIAMETGQSSDFGLPGIRELLLYRADGKSGDPYADMIAIAPGEDGHNGRIVRLRPARQSPSTASVSPTATQPGAIVDFISGFDRPTLMTSGLDGSLYIYDAGAGSLYWIRPA